MNKFAVLTTLVAASMPAFADIGFNTVPVPAALPLFGLGVVALLAVRRFRK